MSMQQKKPLKLWKILVAVIFVGLVFAIMMPFFVGSGDRYVHATHCLNNLRQIGRALRMYQDDYKSYPETLGGYVQTDAKGEVIPFEKAKSKSSLAGGEYTKNTKVFNCPLSPTNKTDAVVEIRISGKTRRYYAYDSYDVYTPDRVDGMVKVGADALRYNSPLVDLKIPSNKTIVTWCGYHHKASDDSRVIAPALFLDGHIKMLPIAQIQRIDGHGGVRWSVKPLKADG